MQPKHPIAFLKFTEYHSLRNSPLTSETQSDDWVSQESMLTRLLMAMPMKLGSMFLVAIILGLKERKGIEKQYYYRGTTSQDISASPC